MSAQPGQKLRVVEAPPAIETRYVEYGEIASGTTTSTRYGRFVEASGFSRAVVLKRLHPQWAERPELVTMFIEQARLSMQLVHANVVQTLDVIESPDDVALVAEYVYGESLASLLRIARSQRKRISLPVACGIAASMLRGLDAAHDAQGSSGEPRPMVHRSVSPQHVLIDIDGVPRLFDFGLAKAFGDPRDAAAGVTDAKLGYMAAEQLHGKAVDRRTDVYAVSAVLWEMLTGVPLFAGKHPSDVAHRALYEPVVAPSRRRSEVSAGLDAIVLRGLHRDTAARFPTAIEMALAIERESRIAGPSEIASWLHHLAGDRLAARARSITDMEERGTRRPQLREISAASRHRLAAEQILVPTPLVTAAPQRGSKAQRLLWALSAIAALGSIGLLSTPAREAETRRPRATTSEPSDVPAPQLPIPEPEPEPEPELRPEPVSESELATITQFEAAEANARQREADSSPQPSAATPPDRKTKRRAGASSKPARSKVVTPKRLESPR